MHIDPNLPTLVEIALIILGIGMLLRLFRQPHIVGYLIAGFVIGPAGLGLVKDTHTIASVGAFGVIVLLFFIGMEASPRNLAQHWRIALLGTLLQILISVAAVWLLGQWLDWPLGRIVLLGFVISLSSTAVVLKLLQDSGELNQPAGQKALGILLVQDLAVVPMIIILAAMSGEGSEGRTLLLQLVGGVMVLGMAIWLASRERIHLPFAKAIRDDHEMQVFAALIACFGLGLLTGLMQLSAALGAFLGGMLVSTAKETEWVHRNLEPFRVVLVALFFVSIGMLIDIHFLREHLGQIGWLVALVLLTNTLINALILRLLQTGWRESLYVGALLSQIGEFSFVLASVGVSSRLISDYAYQVTIAVIALSLLVSPLWIGLLRRSLRIASPTPT